MEEEEIREEISLTSTAIRNMMKTGKIYETQNSSSKRKFEGFSLKELKEHRSGLYMDLEDITGTSGIIVGF